MQSYMLYVRPLATNILSLSDLFADFSILICERTAYGYIGFICVSCLQILASFGCADKSAKKYCLLIYCERKILFRLKKQAEKDGL
jgi:hypothetical protein